MRKVPKPSKRRMRRQARMREQFPWGHAMAKIARRMHWPGINPKKPMPWTVHVCTYVEAEA